MYSNSFSISFILNKIQSLLGELQKIEELIKARHFWCQEWGLFNQEK
jgi:hypothetical protein